MSIILFFIVLAILILSHEFGHFIFAKKAGVRVDEFGFGFPPRIWGVKKGETLYSINLIPFGGFVKIHGEDGEAPTLAESEVGVPNSLKESVGKDKRSFASKPLYIRALILAAGVLFNLFLAWPFLTAGYMAGAVVSIENSGISGGTLTDKGVMIIQVQEKTPAEAAGLQSGDFLLRLVSMKDNEILEVFDVKGVQDFIKTYAGSEIRIDYLRGKEKYSAVATPSLKPENGKGSLGIAMDKVGIIKLPIHRAAWEGLKSTVRLTAATAEALFNFFADIFREKGITAHVVGPIGIVGIVGSATEAGISYLFQLIALLSINLALINFIPFPALDGGRILFLIIELVRRKPISQKISNIANNLGFAILILLMVLVTYQDILRIAK